MSEMSRKGYKRPMRSLLTYGIRHRLGLARDWALYSAPLWKLACSRIPKPRVEMGETEAWFSVDEICNALIMTDIHVKDYWIDIEAYHDFMKSARYDEFPGYCGGGRIPGSAFEEKTLEHFVSFDLMGGLSQDDVYIDIASAKSPAPYVAERLYGCTSYRQDFIFKNGVHGNTIGGDACDMPVKDEFATKMSLHCSFEHFEGHADSRFIRESERVLAHGGRVCILPLYFSTRYFIGTDPTVFLPMRSLPDYDEGATIVCDKGWRNRFGRRYSVPTFVERVVANLGNQDLLVFRIHNAREVSPSCYLSFAVLITKP